MSTEKSPANASAGTMANEGCDDFVMAFHSFRFGVQSLIWANALMPQTTLYTRDTSHHTLVCMSRMTVVWIPVESPLANIGNASATSLE